MVAKADLMRFLGAWMFLHEMADEGMKIHIRRGQEQESGRMGEGTEAFVDGLAAMVAEEKEILVKSLAEGTLEAPGTRADLSEKLDNLQFEVSQLRGHLESIEASLGAVLGAKSPARIPSTD